MHGCSVWASRIRSSSASSSVTHLPTPRHRDTLPGADSHSRRVPRRRRSGALGALVQDELCQVGETGHSIQLEGRRCPEPVIFLGVCAVPLYLLLSPSLFLMLD